MTNNFQQITVNAMEVRFLGLTLDNTLSWNKHIDQLAAKLSSACYASRNIKLLIPQGTLKNNLLCLYTFPANLWHNMLGQLHTCQESIYNNNNNKKKALGS